jgi:tRNA pseudouridine55 synthase
MNGLLVIDKPGGMTSRDVVNRVQKWFPRKTKLGHTGTLDPLATGILVLCVGSATRLADTVQAMGKTYRTRILLGHRSDTDDADGTLIPVVGAVPPDESAIRAAIPKFVGVLSQVPPAYSALKVEGQRAHHLARSGADVNLSARPVTVYHIDLLGYVWPYLDLEIDCGKGTYIRSIARDLGEALGVGGLVQTLRRTQVGPFTVEQGIGLNHDPKLVTQHVLPLSAAAVGMPQMEVSADAANRFRHGQAVPGIVSGGTVAVMHNGELIGIGEAVGANHVRPKVVLT